MFNVFRIVFLGLAIHERKNSRVKFAEDFVKFWESTTLPHDGWTKRKRQLGTAQLQMDSDHCKRAHQRRRSKRPQQADVYPKDVTTRTALLCPFARKLSTIVQKSHAWQMAKPKQALCTQMSPGKI